ncbi:hypothetical protein K3495_g16087 [Podosphaera aphanis]|nr:hypothetical protein K3495_g16087 [Podosphaera aphanis]
MSKSSTEALSKSSPGASDKHLQVKRKSSIEAISKSSPEAENLENSTEKRSTPRAHQQDASASLGDSHSVPIVTRYGRTIKPKSYFIESTKPVYGLQTLQLAHSLSAVSIEDKNYPNPTIDTVSPLFENIDVTEAMKGEDSDLWEQLIKDELQALKDTNTYVICKNDPHVNKKLISSKWVCKYKWNQDGSVARRKSRFVARGFEQVHGSDYLETFATVVRYSTLRTLLAKAVSRISALLPEMNP